MAFLKLNRRILKVENIKEDHKDLKKINVYTFDYSTAGNYEAAKKFRLKINQLAAKDIQIPLLDEDQKKLKESFRLDLIGFVNYFYIQNPEYCFLPLGELHIHVLNQYQDAILSGNQQAVCAPRGIGKDTLLQLATIWALFYGHKKHLGYFCYAVEDAKKKIETIKMFIDNNLRLNELFPEVCVPVQRLERTAQRQGKQTVNGEYSDINWGKGCIKLPKIDGYDQHLNKEGHQFMARATCKWLKKNDIVGLSKP